ncbi:hypothetical protein FLA_0908 [Filimonas lacunae]|nr:hypothetical protein FLA_0908 [Filimonas lacunae]
MYLSHILPAMVTGWFPVFSFGYQKVPALLGAITRLSS